MRGFGRRHSAFTLVEMMVCVGILVVVAGLVSAGIGAAREKARVVRCMSNQRQIGASILGYYNDEVEMPRDAGSGSLMNAVRAFLKDDGVFVCPSERETTATDSYSAYYVQRTMPSGRSFMLGCPRHIDSVALFSDASAAPTGSATVDINGVTVPQESPVADRSIDSGKIDFNDRSVATVDTAGAGFALLPIMSFKLEDNRLYSLVRQVGEGTGEYHVTPGSRFEVITPESVVAVKGTRFKVTTDGFGSETKVVCSEGAVSLVDKASGEQQTIKASEQGQNNAPKKCVRCPKHCVEESQIVEDSGTGNGNGKGKGKGKNNGNGKGKSKRLTVKNHCPKACPLHEKYEHKECPFIGGW